MSAFGSITAVLVALAWSAPGRAAPPPDHPEFRQQESHFRAKLKEFGLVDLLAQRMQDEGELKTGPGTDQGGGDTDADLDLALAKYRDLNRPVPERMKALDQAIGILRARIKNESTHPKRIGWMITLAKLLTISKAEQYNNSILLLGGSAADRAAARKLFAESLELLNKALRLLRKKEKAIEQADEAELERWRDEGTLDNVTQWRTEGDWLKHCTLWYDAMAARPGDPKRKEALETCVSYFRQYAEQEESGVYYEANLFLGAAQAQLGRFDEAAAALTKASVPDSKNPKWVQNLARHERISAKIRQAATLAAAGAVETELKGYETWVLQEYGTHVIMRLAVRLLQVRLLNKQADLTEKVAGQADQAKQLRQKSSQPLQDMIAEINASAVSERKKQAIKGSVYKAVASLVDPQKKLADLDTFAVFSKGMAAVLVAGDWQEGIKALSEVRGRTDPIAQQVMPEAIYYLGVAQYKSGAALQAAKTLTAIAADAKYRRSKLARRGAVLAVRVMNNAFDKNPVRKNLDAFVHAVEVLTGKFPGTKEGKYWQYFYGQLLSRQGKHIEAAEQYARVSEDHEYYAEARWNQISELIQALDALGQDSGAQQKRMRLAEKLAQQGRDTADFLLKQAAEKKGAEKKEVVEWAGQCLLAAARMQQEFLGKPDQAVQTLAGFTERFKQFKSLLGRACRIRALAYNELKEFDKAARQMEGLFAAAGPDAGPVVGGVLEAIKSEIDRARRNGKTAQAEKLAETRLELARKLLNWVREQGDAIKPLDRYLYQRSMASALLDAGKLEQANKLFTKLVAEFRKIKADPDVIDVEALWGQAESLYRLEKYQEALGLFGQIHQRTEGKDEFADIWWRSMLRDLQCRHRIGGQAALIRQSIAGLREIDPNFHNAELKAAFLKLRQAGK